MKPLPRSRRGRAAVAAGLAALLALGVYWYKPWEAHYLGRPTSWWATEYEEVVWANHYSDGGPVPGRVDPWISFGRSPAWWERWLDRIGIRLPARPFDKRLLRGDPAAVPVLVELLRRPEFDLRMTAAYGLAEVGPAARGATPHLLAAPAEVTSMTLALRTAVRRIDPAALAAHDRDHPADGFSLKDLPEFRHGGSYQVDPYLAAAEKLQAAGPEKAERLLWELAEDPDHGHKVIVLCRMLFTAKPRAEFRRPALGEAIFLGSTGYADWPLEPVELVDGVPFLVVRGYGSLGPVEGPKSYAAYSLRDCVWRAAEFKPRDEGEKRKALDKLLASPKWKAPPTDEEKEFLASQID